MKTIINRRALLDAVALAAGIATDRNRPILRCVRITTTADGLEVFSTILERSLLTRLAQAAVSRPGEICVDASELRQAASLFSADSLAIDASGAELAIYRADGDAADQVRLPTLPVADFPPRPPVADGAKLALTHDAFSEAVEAVAGVVADSAGRFACHGVIIRDDGLFVATNGGSRLHRWGSPAKHKSQAIVPPEALKLAAKFAGDTVEITLAENAAVFTCGDHSLTTNVLQGTPLPHEEVVKVVDGHSCIVEMKADELLAAVARGAFATRETVDEKRNLVRRIAAFDFAPNSGLTISARSSAHGESSARLPVKVPGEGVRIGLNPDYVAAAIRACDSDQIRLRLGKPNQAVAIEGGQVLALVMPSHLN